MLDTELRPWLIEVNHSPSFNIDSPLDLAIKEQLITDTIQLVGVMWWLCPATYGNAMCNVMQCSSNVFIMEFMEP